MKGWKLHGRLQTRNAGECQERIGRSEVMEMSELPCGAQCVEWRSPDTFVTCIVSSRCLCAYVRHTQEDIPDTDLCTLHVSDYMNSSSVSQSATVTLILEVKTQQDIQEAFW